MKKSDFYYELPEELIAQDPLEDRSASRLMVLDRNTGKVLHRHFTDILEYLEAGDCMVINNTKVIPARLIGTREKEVSPGMPVPTAPVEILLLKRLDACRWETIVRPGKKLREGAAVSFGNGELKARIEQVLEDGNRIVRFEFDGIFEEILDKLGTMPLPPYITHELKDRNRYQTVYAKYDGSAAAPTAGLHFTEDLLKKVRDMGVDIAEVTLHVGLGTFRPVKEDDILDHKMHSEFFSVTKEAADKINRARKNGHRVICVGTTSLRTVEAAAQGNYTPQDTKEAGASGPVDAESLISPCSGETEIFIYPGYEFKVCDCLITNFHLPESTLIMLVSALAGRENVLAAYKEAVKERYRFFSFGDAMFIH